MCLGSKTYFFELHMTGDCHPAKFQTRCAVKGLLSPVSITTMHDMCCLAYKQSSAHAGGLYIVLRWWGRWGWGWRSDRGRRYALRLPLGLRLQARSAYTRWYSLLDFGDMRILCDTYTGHCSHLMASLLQGLAVFCLFRIFENFTRGFLLIADLSPESRPVSCCRHSCILVVSLQRSTLCRLQGQFEGWSRRSQRIQ